MPRLLHIDTSPLYGASITRELSAAFANHWKAANPDGTTTQRDLTATAIPVIDANWIGAAYTLEEHQTPEQKQILALSDTLISELQEATEYVIGVPMHNFGIPAAFKLWVDHVARVGKTFTYVDGRPKGLVTGKKATFIIATGGIYDAGTQMASFNFVEPYLRALFGFLGVADIKFLTASGAAALRQGQDRAVFLAPHLQAVRSHFHISTDGGAL